MYGEDVLMGSSMYGEDVLMGSRFLVCIVPASSPSGPTISIVISPRFAMRFTVNDTVS